MSEIILVFPRNICKNKPERVVRFRDKLGENYREVDIMEIHSALKKNEGKGSK